MAGTEGGENPRCRLGPRLSGQAPRWTPAQERDEASGDEDFVGNHSSCAGCFGSIQNQQTAPARATNAPRPIPHAHPSFALTHGVTIGASKPIPLPPVFIMAAAVPPRVPPSSTAVVQNAPSHKPRMPSESVNQSTIHKGCVAKMPNNNSTALAVIPMRGTTVRPIV